MLNETERKKLNKLEATIGKKLKELPLKDILGSIANGYSGDEEGNIVGLNLYYAEITDIFFYRISPG